MQRKHAARLLAGLLSVLIVFNSSGVEQLAYAAEVPQAVEEAAEEMTEELQEEESDEATDEATEETTEDEQDENQESDEQQPDKEEVEQPEINEEEVMEDTEDAVSELRADETQIEVTRLQWLMALTKTFNMTVEDNNYPDNYYSDIDSSESYYRDVMLAAEFGLIDVEPGDELRPNDAATREFAAHTLNVCLKFQLEDKSYTFSEADSVTYADDIQIAINRGWFELTDGKFLPEEAVTSEEKTVMLADAQK